jgi:predicted transcriptional regulator
MKYRTALTIIGDVLGIAEDSGIGINHTSLLRRANLSHRSLRRIVTGLVSAELVREQVTEGQARLFNNRQRKRLPENVQAVYKHFWCVWAAIVTSSRT